MKAMILAAGRGRRLGALTDDRPKPLVEFRGKPMIDYALERLQAAGITECVINLFYKGEMIFDYVGDGSNWGLEVSYNEEREELNTGGGVLKALPLLGYEPFLLLNCDLYHDVDLARLAQRGLNPKTLGHLVLVDTATASDPEAASSPAPEAAADHTPEKQGDFNLQDGLVVPGRDYTFAGISIICAELLRHYLVQDRRRRKRFPLVSVLDYAVAGERVTGELHRGTWLDLGTPENLTK